MAAPTGVHVDLTQQRPPSKRPRPRPAAAASSRVPNSNDDGEDFSEDEETAIREDAAPVDWEVPGFDFSGCPCADCAQLECDLCAKELRVSWHHGRKELVVVGAVMLCHRIYHQECANDRLHMLQVPRHVVTRRGPNIGTSASEH
mmetsp:Transcript_27697/g.84542  ORF Transcript_27697/g.84542 Transcript_27697/m.84542 type:complete len:145 (-) Transcript_27697:223-657(-)|eukprot:scaffold190747_cov33-Tisochrysis_lutea.AAC.1